MCLTNIDINNIDIILTLNLHDVQMTHDNQQNDIQHDIGNDIICKFCKLV